MRVIDMGVASAPLWVATQNLVGCRVVAHPGYSVGFVIAVLGKQ